MFNAYNELIRVIYNAGLTDILYQAFNIVNLLSLVVFCFFYGKRYNVSGIKSALIPITIYPLGYLFIYVIEWAETGFKFWGGNHIVKGFIFFPVIGLLTSKIIKVDKKTVWDISAPSLALLQAVAHIACSFAGCCQGYPCDWGLWNVKFNTYLFPVQFLESLVSLIVFIVLIIYASKKEKSSGKVYPVFLILFGSTRFFLEFLRDNEKVIFGISNLAIHALIMCAVGTFWYSCLRAYDKKIKNKKI